MQALRQGAGGAEIAAILDIDPHSPKYAAPSRLYTKLRFTVETVDARQFSVDVDSITMDTTFEDLNADSLDIVELTMALEEEFGLEEMEDEDLSGIATVADLVRYLKSKLDD